MNSIPRRFNDLPEGLEEVPAFIPAGKPGTFTLNPKWQQALWEMDDTGMVHDRMEQRNTAETASQ